MYCCAISSEQECLALVLKAWENHGKSMGKIPWIPLKTMEHGAGAKFHGFHGEIPMLSMLAWDSKNCKITPHESMESME